MIGQVMNSLFSLKTMFEDGVKKNQINMSLLLVQDSISYYQAESLCEV